jgi:hypothetical protein
MAKGLSYLALGVAVGVALVGARPPSPPRGASAASSADR